MSKRSSICWSQWVLEVEPVFYTETLSSVIYKCFATMVACPYTTNLTRATHVEISFIELLYLQAGLKMHKLYAEKLQVIFLY